MDNRITKLSRDPFYVSSTNGVSLVVDPRTGDISMGCAGLRAWKGLVFSLIPAQTGSVLKLQYREITIEVGSTEDIVEVAKWVEDANAFLAAKKDAPPPGKPNGLVSIHVNLPIGADEQPA